MARIIQTADLDNFLPTCTADQQYWVYNGLDCCVTEDVLQSVLPMIDDVARDQYAFSMAMQAPVMEMSMRGLLVDQVARGKVIREMKAKLAVLEDNLQTIVKDGVGVDLNWRSPTQLNKLFYDIMGMPVQKKRNSKGAFSPTTDREALEKLTVNYLAEPICNHLLTMRDLGKSIGFLETAIDPDGRMRSSLNIAGTNTGRLASSGSDFGTGTNLQNVTSKLRSVFVADKGMKFANLDLEQADSRNVGALCWNLFVEEYGETFAGKYLDACESGDLHTFVCKMANPDLGWGDGRTDREIANQIAYRGKSYRDNSKVLGHGSNYLGTPATMSKHSKIPTRMVAAFQQNYFGAFPEIPLWHQNVFNQLEQNGYLITPYGTRRFFFGRPTVASVRREAVAFAPQAMTAKEINIGILKMWRERRVDLLMQVHDSILFQYPEEQEDEIIPWALEALKAPLTLARGREFVVPTEAMTGWNWGYHDDNNNPDGLKKWKGHDSRQRQVTETKLDFRRF